MIGHFLKVMTRDVKGPVGVIFDISYDMIHIDFADRSNGGNPTYIANKGSSTFL